MSYSYIAYIDESGDDGLRVLRSPGVSGSTNWLVLSCCVARHINRLEFVKWRDQIATLLPNRKRRDIHFSELNDRQQLMATQKIAQFHIRAISILSNKITISPGIYTQKNQLYHYLARYLLERVSWLCRDMRPSVPEGNGQVQIVFSRRGGMDYQDFQEYLRRLKLQSQNGSDVRIHWPVIDINAVQAVDHSSDAGLQIADCIASSCRLAVDPDEYGNCWDRSARELKPIIYNKEGNFLSYGLKPLPNISDMSLTAQQSNFFSYFQ